MAHHRWIAITGQIFGASRSGRLTERGAFRIGARSIATVRFVCACAHSHGITPSDATGSGYDSPARDFGGLRYGLTAGVIEGLGVRPTPGGQLLEGFPSNCRGSKWAQRDSNPRHLPCKSPVGSAMDSPSRCDVGSRTFAFTNVLCLTGV